MILTKKAKNSYFSIRTNSITIPFSFHQLSPDINTVQVEFRDSSLNTKTVNISLTPGNYNCINVLDQLKAKLIEQCQINSFPYVGYTPNLTFSYSSTTNKSSYILTGDPNNRITIFFSQNLLLGKFFGFSNNLIISPVLNTSLNTCVANPVHSIYLRCGNLKQLYNREWIVEKAVYSDVLYVCPIFSQTNTYIQSNHQGDECLLSDETIKSINLYLSTNLSYTPIELNGLDFSTSLTISEMLLDQYIPIETTLLNNIAYQSPSILTQTTNETNETNKRNETNEQEDNIADTKDEPIDTKDSQLELTSQELIKKLLKEKKRLERKLKNY